MQQTQTAHGPESAPRFTSRKNWRSPHYITTSLAWADGGRDFYVRLYLPLAYEVLHRGGVVRRNTYCCYRRQEDLNRVTHWGEENRNMIITERYRKYIFYADAGLHIWRPYRLMLNLT